MLALGRVRRPSRPFRPAVRRLATDAGERGGVSRCTTTISGGRTVGTAADGERPAIFAQSYGRGAGASRMPGAGCLSATTLSLRTQTVASGGTGAAFKDGYDALILTQREVTIGRGRRDRLCGEPAAGRGWSLARIRNLLPSRTGCIRSHDGGQNCCWRRCGQQRAELLLRHDAGKSGGGGRRRLRCRAGDRAVSYGDA